MIDVDKVLAAIPRFDTFCSVARLREQAEALASDPRFRVETCGTSRDGLPIHHVRFGKGAIKALLVAGPHCMEPIGSLTVYSVLELLRQGHRELVDAGVEWNIVPCIDPDGALLNEGWTQKPFAIDSFLRHFYLQPWGDAVDTSFAVEHKRLVTRDPSKEARVLQGVIDRVKPDFFFSLHNTFAGGAFFLLNRDIGQPHYERIYALLRRLAFPLRSRPQFSEFLQQYSPGITEIYGVRKHYDFLERSMPNPEAALKIGAGSFEYAAEVNPEALVFVAEMGYWDHPYNGSPRDTGQNLRQFKLRMEADAKYLATVMLSTWQEVESEVDRSSPLFRAVAALALPTEQSLVDGGMPISRYPTRDTLLNPVYDRPMTEDDKFEACVVNDGLKLLAFDYMLLRLLHASPQTPAIRKAAERLGRALGDMYAEIDRHCDLGRMRRFECDTLARVQLGSGLVALNSLLTP